MLLLYKNSFFKYIIYTYNLIISSLKYINESLRVICALFLIQLLSEFILFSLVIFIPNL